MRPSANDKSSPKHEIGVYGRQGGDDPQAWLVIPRGDIRETEMSHGCHRASRDHTKQMCLGIAPGGETVLTVNHRWCGYFAAHSAAYGSAIEFARGRAVACCRATRPFKACEDDRKKRTRPKEVGIYRRERMPCASSCKARGLAQLAGWIVWLIPCGMYIIVHELGQSWQARCSFIGLGPCWSVPI